MPSALDTATRRRGLQHEKTEFSPPAISSLYAPGNIPAILAGFS